MILYKCKEGNKDMKTYYIYNADNYDEIEFVGTVEAMSINEAELKAYRTLNVDCNVYALTTAPGEDWA